MENYLINADCVIYMLKYMRNINLNSFGRNVLERSDDQRFEKVFLDFKKSTLKIRLIIIIKVKLA